VPKITKPPWGHYRELGEETIEEMGLKAIPNDSQWRRQRDFWHSVPQSGRSHLKSSIADGWNTSGWKADALDILCQLASPQLMGVDSEVDRGTCPLLFWGVGTTTHITVFVFFLLVIHFTRFG